MVALMRTGAESRRGWRRKSLIVGTALLVLGATAVGGAYAATAALKMADPVTIARALATAPSQRAGLFPNRAITASDQPRPAPPFAATLPRSVPWNGESVSVVDFLEFTKTNSFVVLHRGGLVHEWYREGVGASTPQWSYSLAKSVTSLLAGMTIEKRMLSEEERLVDVLPELRAGTEYDSITIRNLLDMTSGVDVSENTSSINPFSGTVGMGLSTDLDSYFKSHRDMKFRPGSRGEYRSIDTALLAAAVVRREGRNLSELLQERIWDPIGAEQPATWTIDHPGGREQGFAGINATARDFAKIGQLMLDDGRVGDRQVVPARWLERIRTPAELPVDDLGYSAQWWHYPGGNGSDYSAVGIYGQYIYVDPHTQTVVVKLSDYGAEQDERATVDVLRSIATGLR